MLAGAASTHHRVRAAIQEAVAQAETSNLILAMIGTEDAPETLSSLDLAEGAEFQYISAFTSIN